MSEDIRPEGFEGLTDEEAREKEAGMIEDTGDMNSDAEDVHEVIEGTIKREGDHVTIEGDVKPPSA